MSRQRQLKRRITEWHLNKNVKDFEMRNLLRKQSRHLSRGKKSIFFIRGRQVDHRKIERFSRRKNVKENNCTSDNVAGQLVSKSTLYSADYYQGYQHM